MSSRSNKPSLWCEDISIRQRVGRFSSEIAAGELSGLNDIFIEQGLAAPVVRIDPQEADLPGTAHKTLLGYWLANRSGAEIMPRHKVDPVELRTLLGNLMLLEASPDGLDFKYRVYGTVIADQVQRDWTGWSVGRMTAIVGSKLGVFYRAIYAASALLRRPIFTEHSSPASISAARWQRLIVPLSDADGKCCFFLATNYPVKFQEIDKSLEADYLNRILPR